MAMSSTSTIWTSARRTSASLEVHLLGLVDFDSALLLQERLAYEVSGRCDTLGHLLICEHPPILTIGREGRQSHVLADEHELTARQIETRRLNRGGGCLLHAPGQLAVYPILPLDRLQMGLSEYRARLELSLLDICGELRLPAFRRADEPGGWCRCGQFAHLGIAVRSWVSMHGLFVNISPDMRLLRMVQPNQNGERVTSLAAERARTTSMHSVRESLIRNLAKRLGYEQFHLYTGHPLLTRKKKQVYVGA